jgi:hypothetical protein
MWLIPLAAIAIGSWPATTHTQLARGVTEPITLAGKLLPGTVHAHVACRIAPLTDDQHRGFVASA